MGSDPNIVDRIKPFIRKLEGSIEQARRERMQREGGPLTSSVNGGAGSAAQKPAACSPSPASRPGAGHSFIGGATRPAAAPPASSTPNSTPSSTDSTSSDPRKAIPRGMQARPLVRRTTI